jgi:predicted tellurium resistance membrane protein TerC
MDILSNLITLGMLVMLQAVLGFDNLLYISLESKNAPPERQGYVRKVGIGLAIVLRIALLFAITTLIRYAQKSLFVVDQFPGVVEGDFNLHSLIVLVGGGFILYTAMKEIWAMISLEEHEQQSEKKSKSVAQVITMIVVMNLVFSFDSILSAIALTDVFWVMATAIVIGGLLMIWLADTISQFLQKNRMYEVLGLFILFLVGVMLVSEGGHLAHLKFFDSEITPMSKTTFYFVLVILVLTDIVQGRYQRKLAAEKRRQWAGSKEQSAAGS